MNAKKIEINCNEGPEVLHDYQSVTSIITHGETLWIKNITYKSKL